MRTVTYRVPSFGAPPCTLALVSDLHGHPYDRVVAALTERKPDVIAAVGDVTGKTPRETSVGFAFLRDCANIAPTLYSRGNHENSLSESDREQVRQSGALLLDNDETALFGVRFGGLTSFTVARSPLPKGTPLPKAGADFLDRFCEGPGPRVLLCHHPEYYEPYLKGRGIDLVLSGHAHGGQIRLFGRGLFAPGRGILPKYTSGLYDGGRLLVGRGLANTIPYAPRLFNETETVFVEW